MEFVLIFFSKTLEVTISTLRNILINKGYRVIGTILSFFEIVLWLMVASKVITEVNENIYKGLMYCLGFSTGVYFGSKLENKLAFGKILVQCIIDNEEALNLTKILRENGYGVTVVDAKGLEKEKSILMIYANRKGKDDLLKIINEQNYKTMVTINEVSTLQGGYIKKTSIFK